jgi:hypothetical protein
MASVDTDTGEFRFLTCKQITNELGWQSKSKRNKSEMALFSECMPSCAQKSV